MVSGLLSDGAVVARGSASFTELVSSGAVTMKITSRTSITSISGTMLISPIGELLPLESKLANAMVCQSFGEVCCSRGERLARAGCPRSLPARGRLQRTMNGETENGDQASFVSVRLPA